MFSSIKRGARLAAVVGLSAAVVIGLAGPASAAPGTNQGIGLVADGLIDVGPLAQANFPGGPPTSTVVNANAPGLLSSGTVNATADADGATASVEDLSVTLSLLATLTAGVVSSECSVNGTTVTGDSTLADAQVAILSGLPVPIPPVVINLDANAAPNTTVSVPGIATITLNRQVVAPDGTLTVDAIFISLLGSTQTVTIATSVCGPATVVIPVIAPQFAIGAGVLGLLGMGVVLYRRRQTAGVAQV